MIYPPNVCYECARMVETSVVVCYETIGSENLNF